MEIRKLTQKDIDGIGALTPEGWKDITPYFQYYVENLNCQTFLWIEDDIIVGTGNISYTGENAWLSHIIVKPQYQKHGIGGQITALLIEEGKAKNCKTISLIATSFGAPVYAKRGFRKVCEYYFIKAGEVPVSINTEVVAIELHHASKILKMDREVVGEDRSFLFKDKMNGWMVMENEKIRGYYLPDVWEGPVVALDEEAANALLEIKFKKDLRIVVPEGNKRFIESLMQNGGVEFHERGVKMILGEDVNWQAEKIYGRIGGAFG